MFESTFNTGLVNLNYSEGKPSGPPLLLLHGGANRWQSFLPIIPELENEWHIYALDLRGHGKSDRSTDKGYKIEDYVSDVLAFITSHINEPPIIFGHSLGGMIGIMLAAYNTSLVKALIIGDSTISIEALKETSNSNMTVLLRDLAKSKSIEYTISQLKKMPVPVPKQKGMVPLCRILGEDNPLFHFIAEGINQCDSETLSSAIERFDETYGKYKLDKILPMIQCPVLLIQGNPELGGLMRDQDVKIALNLLPKAKHIKLLNIGHTIMFNREEVINAIKPFMKSLYQEIN